MDTIPEPLKTVDQTLAALASDVKVLSHAKPLNVGAERDAFLNGDKRNPDFRYRDPLYDTTQIASALEQEVPADGDIGVLLTGMRKKLLLEHRMITHLGDEDIVREASLELFGRPSPELVAQADGILRDSEPEDIRGEANLTAEAVAARFQAKLIEVGLTNWKAKPSKQALVVTTNSNGVIKIPAKTRFSESGSAGLIPHEIGVHAIRSENGGRQPLQVLRHGLLDYFRTEEGLAAFAQERTGTLRNRDLRSYAARVIAVDSVYQGMDFRDTFDRLMAYGNFTENEAYKLTLRAHRAGGYLKDAIYLDGLNMLRHFASQGGDFETLYSGKVALAQLDVVRRLQEQGILNKPKHLPWFMGQLQNIQ